MRIIKETEIDLQLVSIDSDMITFAAVLDGCVPTVPKEMEDYANKMAAMIGCKIRSIGGDLAEVWFAFDREITEDEGIKLEEYWDNEEKTNN